MSRIVKLGEVAVDSGQLMICDPCYIDSSWQKEQQTGYDDFAHQVYRHKKDGSLWQYTYNGNTSVKTAQPFPGSYDEVIAKYGKSPNQLVKEGLFIKTDIDPRPHITDGEFSYVGGCKATDPVDQGGQLNFPLGHAGAGVVFRSGFGDGSYPVYAELQRIPGWGERVVKVWVELVNLEEE